MSDYIFTQELETMRAADYSPINKRIGLAHAGGITAFLGFLGTQFDHIGTIGLYAIIPVVIFFLGIITEFLSSYCTVAAASVTVSIIRRTGQSETALVNERETIQRLRRNSLRLLWISSGCLVAAGATGLMMLGFFLGAA